MQFYNCYTYFLLILVLQACGSSPCQNDAICFDGLNGGYLCRCLVGYEGANCETGKYIGRARNRSVLPTCVSLREVLSNFKRFLLVKGHHRRAKDSYMAIMLVKN